MQYILTQEEMDDLHRKSVQNENMPTLLQLQEFCTMVSNTLPLTKGWRKGEPWGCILTKDRDEWYCDDCPSQEICPCPYKNWSK